MQIRSLIRSLDVKRSEIGHCPKSGHPLKKTPQSTKIKNLLEKSGLYESQYIPKGK